MQRFKRWGAQGAWSCLTDQSNVPEIQTLADQMYKMRLIPEGKKQR